jgi:cytochrome P450
VVVTRAGPDGAGLTRAGPVPARLRPAGRRPDVIGLRHTLPGLARDPLRAFTAIGARAAGRVVRLDLGLFRPYLVTRPEHVQHVMRDNGANYVRDGMMWRPLRRLFGDGLGGEGAEWEPSRRLIQPMFSSRAVGRLLTDMADEIAVAVDELAGGKRRIVDAEAAMTRIVQAVLVRVFFGGRLSAADADRLGRAVSTAFTSMAARMLLPFVPESVPLPGDRAFRRSVRTADEILFPLVRELRARPDPEATDIASRLCRARDEQGQHLSDQRVRDDIIAMFAAGTETTAVALVWLWVALHAHPHVARRLVREVDEVVGAGPARPEHLPGLRYAKMVFSELLRLYPIGWVIPRTIVADDVIDGVRVNGGGTVILSPYLTQRRPDLWPDPDRFDPERFDPAREHQRPRFAYFPFSGGAHACLGGHLSTVEAQLVAATMLTRFRPRIRGDPPPPRAAVSLRPDRNVELVLHAR